MVENLLAHMRESVKEQCGGFLDMAVTIDANTLKPIMVMFYVAEGKRHPLKMKLAMEAMQDSSYGLSEENLTLAMDAIIKELIQEIEELKTVS